MKYLALLLAVATTASALELTIDNYEAETAGKYVFLKFHAPWCGHCKRLKPAWTILANEFRDSPTTFIGDVDCTSPGGMTLCSLEKVKSYPTLLWGDPANMGLDYPSLTQYEGGRSMQEMADFAREHVRPMCSAGRLDLCDAAQRAEVGEIAAMPAEEFKAQYISELPHLSRENIAECGGGDGVDGDGGTDVEGCAEALAAETKKVEDVPAEDLKIAFIDHLLTGGGEAEAETEAEAEAGGSDEL